MAKARREWAMFATGIVVVGDLIGSGASQEQAIVGETPNLAARLQGVAEPNSVEKYRTRVCGSEASFSNRVTVSRDFADTAFARNQYHLSFAGLRPSPAPHQQFDFFFAPDQSGQGTGVQCLKSALYRRRSQDRPSSHRSSDAFEVFRSEVFKLEQVAHEPPSALRNHLLERLAAQPHTRLRYFCSPQHTDSAF